jgi:hypothetical protein
MPDRDGDLVEIVQRFREMVLERLNDHSDFHDSLNGPDPIEFDGWGATPNTYHIERHEALIWKDPVGYNDELQRWREAADHEVNREAIEHLTNTNQLPVFRELCQVIQRKRVAPFVGAGSSACLNFPLWRDGLTDLAGRLEAGGNARVISRCRTARTAISRGRYIEAGAILYGLDKVQVDNYVSTTYSVPPNISLNNISGLVRLLPELADGCMITTNFDNLIERIFQHVGKPIEGYMHGSEKHHKFAVSLIRGDRCILKLHGDFSDADTYIFSTQQYDRAYGNPLDFTTPLARSLRQIYVSHSLLFLGCGLGPDRTLEVFQAVINSNDFDLPTHYAILEEPALPAERQAKENRLLPLKIRPIWYQNRDHAMVEKLLRLALDCAKGKVSV